MDVGDPKVNLEYQGHRSKIAILHLILQVVWSRFIWMKVSKLKVTCIKISMKLASGLTSTSSCFIFPCQGQIHFVGGLVKQRNIKHVLLAVAQRSSQHQFGPPSVWSSISLITIKEDIIGKGSDWKMMTVMMKNNEQPKRAIAGSKYTEGGLKMYFISIRILDFLFSFFMIEQIHLSCINASLFWQEIRNLFRCHVCGRAPCYRDIPILRQQFSNNYVLLSGFK